MSIEWSTFSWNPTIGCSPVSPGCAHCYAQEQAFKLRRMGNLDYDGLTKSGPQHALWTGVIKKMPQRLAEPLHKRKPQVIFVNSMSDLFHPKVSNEFIAAVFGIMAATPQHQYIILTKHIERAAEFFKWIRTAQLSEPWEGARMGQARELSVCAMQLCAEAETDKDRDEFGNIWDVANVVTFLNRTGWPLPNVWLGPSLESYAMVAKRAEATLAITQLGWNIVLSCEPLLDDLCAKGVALGAIAGAAESRLWVIAGGESGENARSCDIDWLRKLRDACAMFKVPFYCKQLGSQPVYRTMKNFAAPGGGAINAFLNAGEPLRHPRGGDPAEWPEELRVFQAPPAIAKILNDHHKRQVTWLEPAVPANESK